MFVGFRDVLIDMDMAIYGLIMVASLDSLLVRVEGIRNNYVAIVWLLDICTYHTHTNEHLYDIIVHALLVYATGIHIHSLQEHIHTKVYKPQSVIHKHTCSPWALGY